MKITYIVRAAAKRADEKIANQIIGVYKVCRKTTTVIKKKIKYQTGLHNPQNILYTSTR